MKSSGSNKPPRRDKKLGFGIPKEWTATSVYNTIPIPYETLEEPLHKNKRGWAALEVGCIDKINGKLNDMNIDSGF